MPHGCQNGVIRNVGRGRSSCQVRVPSANGLSVSASTVSTAIYGVPRQCHVGPNAHPTIRTGAPKSGTHTPGCTKIFIFFNVMWAIPIITKVAAPTSSSDSPATVATASPWCLPVHYYIGRADGQCVLNWTSLGNELNYSKLSAAN